MTYVNDHATRIKIVESGQSLVFNNWHEHAGITMEDFIRELEWLDSDPCDGGRGDQMTRELGCTERDGLVRLKRVYSKLGFESFYRMDDGHRFVGKVSISCRDRV